MNVFRKYKYLIIFILIIPLFAFVYTLCRTQFRSSTLLYEENTKNFKNEIKYKIRKELATSYNYGIKNNKHILSERCELIVDNIVEINDVKIDDDSIIIQMEIKYLNLFLYVDKDRKTRSASFSERRTFIIATTLLPNLYFREGWTNIWKNFYSSGSPFDNKIYSEEYIMYAVSDSSIGGSICNFKLSAKEIEDMHDTDTLLISTFFPNLYRTLDSSFYCLFSKDLREDFVKLRDMEKGISIEFQDTFFRMLYFSAVTITTVGYGDIVPITNEMRLLVGLEAVVGIILLGAFVNSKLK